MFRSDKVRVMSSPSASSAGTSYLRNTLDTSGSARDDDLNADDGVDDVDDDDLGADDDVDDDDPDADYEVGKDDQKSTNRMANVEYLKTRTKADSDHVPAVNDKTDASEATRSDYGEDEEDDGEDDEEDDEDLYRPTGAAGGLGAESPTDADAASSKPSSTEPTEPIEPTKPTVEMYRLKAELKPKQEMTESAVYTDKNIVRYILQTSEKDQTFVQMTALLKGGDDDNNHGSVIQSFDRIQITAEELATIVKNALVDGDPQDVQACDNVLYKEFLHREGVVHRETT